MSFLLFEVAMLFLSHSLVYLVAVDHLAEANMYYASKIFHISYLAGIKEPIARVKLATRLKSGLGAGPSKPRRATSTVTNQVFFFTAV